VQALVFTMSIWNKFSTPTPKKRWMDDSESSTCLLCLSEWTVRLRRHHCRVCYRLVCSNCSDHFVELDSDGVSHRVCDECFPKLDIHLDLPCHTLQEDFPHHPVVGNDALFKIVLHHVQGLFPLPQKNAFVSSSHIEVPTRYVYCVIGTAEKHSLKTTKTRQCDPHMQFKADFEESIVVKADMSKALESYLIFKVCDKSGQSIGNCRVALGDVTDDAEFSKVLLCKELPLCGADPKEHDCLPSITLSINRLSSLGGVPDLPMYSTRIPYAVDFSQFPASARKHRRLPLVHLFPPCSDVHTCLFLPLVPPGATSSGLAECRSQLSQTVIREQTALPLSATAVVPANEILLEAIGDILLQSASGGIIVKGVLLCTTHRLVFVQYPLSDADESMGTGTDIGIVQCFPIPIISSLQVHRKYKGGNFCALQLTYKDSTGHIFICADVSANSSEQPTNVALATFGSSPLRKTAPPPLSYRALDAFLRLELEISWMKLEDSFTPSILTMNSNRNNSSEGVFDAISPEQELIRSPFSLLKEYLRLGLNLPADLISDVERPVESADLLACNVKLSKTEIRYPYGFQSKWRISTANASYQTCPTYPKVLVVPRAISDSHIATSSKQRSINRIPVLTWIHPDNGAALCRSSQPLVGFVESACPEDETLLMSIRACTFFSCQVNHRQSSSHKKLPSRLRRHGYRVRRDSLSNRHGDTSRGKSKQNDVMSGTLKRLETNFFGESKCEKPISAKRMSAQVNRKKSPMPSELRRRQSLTKKKNFPSPLLGQDTADHDGQRKNLVEESSDEWYYPTKIDFTDESTHSVGLDEVPNEVMRNKCGETKIFHERDITKKNQQFDTLSSDGLRRHNKRLLLKMKKKDLHRKKVSNARLSPRNLNPQGTPPSVDDHKGTESDRHVRLRIIDARPFINAKGNALMGKGYEVVERLGGNRCTTLEFANIANIHVVRDSYQALRQACSLSRAVSSIYQTGDGIHSTFSATDSAAAGISHIHISNANQSNHSTQAVEAKCENWGAMVADTKWLQHLSSVMRGGLKCAEYLMTGDPVLVHCSDGWDRTSQLTGLAQLLVDPEYRTIVGFKALISKDFGAFGHMFRSRSGGVGLHADVNQESPVFIQFLDAVWQIWRQMPWEFEFTQELLELLVYCYHSRYTIDFRYNNDSEQTHYFQYMSQEFQSSSDNGDSSGLPPDSAVHENVMISAWMYISLHLTAFTNLLYKPSGKPARLKINDGSERLPPAPEMLSDDSGNTTKLNTVLASCMGGVIKSQGNQEKSDMLKNTPCNTSGCNADGEDVSEIRLSPSDENFEFRNRSYAGVRDAKDLDALKELISDDNGYGEDSAPPSKISPITVTPVSMETKNKSKVNSSCDASNCVPIFTDDLSLLSKRWVHLLTPNCEVSELLLWESVYFNGLAMPPGVKVKAHSTSTNEQLQKRSVGSTPGISSGCQNSTTFTFTTAASASVAYERGLAALCREQHELLRDQELEIKRLREMIAGSVSGTNEQLDRVELRHNTEGIVMSELD